MKKERCRKKRKAKKRSKWEQKKKEFMRAGYRRAEDGTNKGKNFSKRKQEWKANRE